MNKSIFVLGATVAFFANPAFAWDSQGHMMVAAVAWNQLTPTVKARASELLKLNPSYPDWALAAPSGDVDHYAFVQAATWPDAIKDDPDYNDDGESPSGPEAGQNIGYLDHLQHRYWHFIDTPLSTDGTPVVDPTEWNAKTQIEEFQAAIASTSTGDDIKSYDLVWLEHLVGDVHQPLHATSRFSRDLPYGDRGGNSVSLCARPCRSNLHAFWDDVLGDSKDPAAAISAAGRLAPPDPTEAAIADDKVWITESFGLARDYAYASPVGPGRGPYLLDGTYKSDALNHAQQQVELAGVRLAKLLNASLK